MTDPFENLHRVVLTELEVRKARIDAAKQNASLKRLGVFLDECLANLGLSRTDFARQLGIERELADAILDNLLPESEIDDEFLVEIAKVVKYEPNLFRLMLGRSIQPALQGETKPTVHSEDM
jgi:plasmid maintenance system antidote protein VapI